jgi:hypothetical protein
MSPKFFSLPTSDRGQLLGALTAERLEHFYDTLCAILDSDPRIGTVTVAQNTLIVPLCGGAAVLSGEKPLTLGDLNRRGLAAANVKLSQ